MRFLFFLFCVVTLSSFALVPDSPHHLVEKSKKSSKHKSVSKPSKKDLVSQDAVQFLLVVNSELEKKGFSVLSGEKIIGLVKTMYSNEDHYKDEVLNKRFLLMKDAFFVFIEKIFLKNPTMSFESYQLPLDSFTVAQRFFVQLLPSVINDVQEDIDDGDDEAADDIDISFAILAEKTLTSEYLESLYKSFFSEQDIEYTSVNKVCIANSLEIPAQSVDQPVEFVNLLYKLNTNKDEVKRIEKLSTNSFSPFTKWLVQSLQYAVCNSDYGKDEIRVDMLYTLFSLLCDAE